MTSTKESDKIKEKAKVAPQQKNGIIGILCFYSFFIFGTIILALSIVIQRMPNKIDPISYEMPPPPSLTGALTENERLKSSTVLLKSIKGPESMVFHGDHLFTGTSDGKIMKIDKKGGTKIFAKFGSGDRYPEMGRPLGMRLDPSKKFLFVVDAYLGLFKVDLSTGKHEKIFPIDEGYKVNFFDDLDILPNGDVIISVASVKYPYHELVKECLESRPNGQLLKINLKDQSHEIIKDNLFFANGVQRDLRGKGDSVLLAESTRNRILRVYVTGPKKGQSEVFADNLPGAPDNIRPSANMDGYWVSLEFIRSKEHDCQGHLFSQHPGIRQIIAKVVPESIITMAGSQYNLVIKLDLDGRIVESLHERYDTVLPSLTQVTEHSGALYFGNFDGVGIGYLPLKCKQKNTCFFINS